METLKNMLKNNIRQYGMVIALVVIMAIFQVLTDGTLMMPLNITNLILQNSYILVLAVGMLIVIVAFQIDLSVGSIAAFVGAIAGILMAYHNVPTILAVILCLVIGAIIGAWHGFWVAYIKLPAFIVTLAGMLVFRGLTYVALNGTSIAPFPSDFQQISFGFIPDFFNGKSLHITTIVIGIILTILYVAFGLKKRNEQNKYGFEVIPQGLFIAKMVVVAAAINFFTYILAQYKGIPNVLLILAFLIIFYTFVCTKTVIGRHIYALGGNAKAAKLSGIKTERLTFFVFVNMGAIAALSGLVFAARLNAATPNAGTNFELDAIAACYIGGVSASGGIGTIMGAMIGGLVMGVLNNGMSLCNVGIDWQQTIKGLVLLFAVAFDVFTKTKNS